MHTHSLFELNEHIRRVVALNFQMPLWIVAEIAQIGESRGHHYLDLVQKGEDGDAIAQAQAVLWATEFRQINARFPFGLLPMLRDGLELRLQVRPEVHERYGLKLHITDIDPAHTFGQLELLRRQTIATLREQGLFDLNRSLPLPLALQKIAVISSENAAGLQDFREHLEENSFGYAFDLEFFSAAVQGKNAEAEVIGALQKISAQREDFDCAVLVRGGGAKLDLMAFDGLALCQAAAQIPIPLLVGIGHDVDETVLDLLAHSSLKTPTAVADFLIQHNLFFEGQVLETAQTMETLAGNFLKTTQIDLEQTIATLKFSAKEQTLLALGQLGFLETKISELTAQTFQNRHQTLESLEILLQNLRPENVLKRGFSITTKNGKALSSIAGVVPGEELETWLSDGRVKSKTI